MPAYAQNRKRRQCEAEAGESEDGLIAVARAVKESDQPAADLRCDDVRQIRRNAP